MDVRGHTPPHIHFFGYLFPHRKFSDKERAAYNVVMADWLNPPHILEVDLGGWNGAAQDLIRMRVRDDVKVASVSLEISDETGAVLESGQAVDAGASWWEYRVGQPLSGALRVTVSASDLPGHVTQATEEKLLIRTKGFQNP